MSGFFNSVKEVIAQKPGYLKKPYIFNTKSDNSIMLDKLMLHYPSSPENAKPRLLNEIKLLEYCIAGEINALERLRRSSLPIIVLQDLHIEYEGMMDKIDYMIIAAKTVLIIQCGNLAGHVEVTAEGRFMRTFQSGGCYVREEIESPAAKNKRHLEMIKNIRIENAENLVSKTLIEKYFYENYKAVIMPVNAKAVINTDNAPENIKEQIINWDMLPSYLEKLMEESSKPASTEKKMFELAHFFLKLNNEDRVDYIKKYGNPENIAEASNASTLDGDLRKLRLQLSNFDGVKPYFIFNNSQLEEIVSAMPETMEELKKIPGFNDVKCRKYGEKILEIVQKYKKS